MTRFLFVGNSHLLSLIDAARQAGATGGTVPDTRSIWFSGEFLHLDATFDGAGGAVRARFVLLGGFVPPPLEIGPEGCFGVRAEYLAQLDEAAKGLGGPPDQVVSCFHGNEHAIFSMMEHPEPFDVLVESGDAVGPGPRGPRQIVPIEVLRRELDDRANPTVFTCELLRARFPLADVVHVLPPPPIADDSHIESHPEVFGPLIAEHGLAPAPLRRKIYRLYADVLGARLSAIGVRLAGPPGDALDDGYLREGFWMGATHANHRYGQLVLEGVGAA